MSRSIRVCALALLLAGGCEGQSAFDAASIKPSGIPHEAGEGSGRERQSISPGGIGFTNTTLSNSIQWAYGVKFYQVAGPEWIRTERYDIQGRTEQHATPDQLRVMMQSLLADRFHLQVHRERRLESVYELVARKDRVRLPQSNQAHGIGVTDGSFVFRHFTMEELAAILSELIALDRPTVDRTAIPGSFDITLRNGTAATRDDPSPIFMALEELGLELKAAKAPLDVIVVDHAERPDAN